jgi:hypothetical protein
MPAFTKIGLDALVTPENCVFLLIDHQPFQLANVNSHDPTLVIHNVTALAKTAKAFGIPTILTTVNEERGGALFKQLQAVPGDVRTMPEAAEILTQALGRPIAFAQTPIEQVRQYSKEMALMLEWFERVGYSADIAGLEREFGRMLTKLPDWARRHA